MKLRLIMLGSFGVGILATAGLAAVVYYEPPTTAWSAAALGLVVLAVMGWTAPIWRLILRRFQAAPDAYESAIMALRFGLWSGLFVASILILKILQFMDSILILAVLGLLIMIEMFLQQNALQKRTSRRRR